jgi:hypothetical protein
MALIASLGALCGAGAFCFFAMACGHRLLRFCHLEVGGDTEHLLHCGALGVIAFEAAVFFLEPARTLRIAILLLLGVVVAVGISELRQVRPRLARIVHNVATGSPQEKLLLLAIFLVLLFEGAAATAPLTGSDALHYHFTAPLLVLREGWQPNFFLAHSFLTGQGHLLILTGLALGSEKLSLALLFLGGVLSAAAAACLARKWMSRTWSLVAALTFLLTPVVFWQITSAGTPDLCMSFFAAMGVLAIARCGEDRQRGLTVFAGILAGALAGAKYTGCIVAASLALAYFWETRSFRRLALFFCAAFSAGIWPYARNFVWTGDPVFPFLLRPFARVEINSYALSGILADTGATGARNFWQFLNFPLFANIDHLHLGFWQFFGPLCMVFAPLLLLTVRNTPLWRAALIVWAGTSLGIGATSGMTRFLLPILPIALAAVFAGAAALREMEWRFARRIATASICLFLLMGAAGLLLYSRAAVSAAAGLTSREDYLLQRAPDYAKAEFVNGVLDGKGSTEKVLVFFRHVYYLRVPFAYGDPVASWPVDPQRLNSPEAWETFLRSQGIRWVVRGPDYPAAIAAPLRQLELSGGLVAIAQGEVNSFEGMRIFGVRKTTSIVVLQVKD